MVLKSIIYIFAGSTFISIYKDHSFWLIINGNGGFVGRNIKEFIYNFNGLVNQNITFFLLLSLTIIFFLLSIQFRINTFYNCGLDILILGSLLFFFYKEVAFKVSVWIYLMVGVWTWAEHQRDDRRCVRVFAATAGPGQGRKRQDRQE